MKTALRSQIKTAFSMAGASPWPPLCRGSLGPAGTKKPPDRDRIAVSNPNLFFDGWGGPAATAWLWVSYQTPSNRGWRCLLRPLLSHLLPCLALPLLRLLLPRRCSRQRLALQDRWRPRCLQHLPRAPRQALWHTFGFPPAGLQEGGRCESEIMEVLLRMPPQNIATVPPLSFRDRRAVLIQDRVL